MVSQGYQINGGRFIKIYMICSIVLVLTVMIVLIVGTIVMSCMPGSKADENQMDGKPLLGDRGESHSLEEGEQSPSREKR
jgi:hypothetical protein